MILKKWEDLPDKIRNDAVKQYYEVLNKKRYSLYVKRFFDICFSLIGIILLFPLFICVSIIIKLYSPGPVFFKQKRITQYGKSFFIIKFRTMSEDAEKKGPSVTGEQDSRITPIGGFLRRYRLDEIPQLFNILAGDMTFVSTRPEISKYVQCYTEEMLATLLLPAGVTSEASIMFKDESKLLNRTADIDEMYIKEILPEKMKYNLVSLRNFGIMNDIRTMFRTAVAVLSRQ